MSATISIVCYKSKVLKNNESPLMLRICKDGKRKYESIGISLDPKYWDFKANKPTSKCPNKEYIEKVITEKTKAYTDKILELKAMEREFTVTTLAEKVNNPIIFPILSTFHKTEQQQRNRIQKTKAIYEDKLHL